LPAPATTPQYYERGGSFVRADVTYLRQDFSVVQMVANPGVWPGHQRYDFLVRLRPLAAKEVQTLAQMFRDKRPTGQKDATLFALRELTGKDFAEDVSKWQAYVDEHYPPSEAERTASIERLTTSLVRVLPDWQEPMLLRLRDGNGAPYTDALVSVIGKLKTSQPRAREVLAERLGRETVEALRESLRSKNLEVRQAAAQACLSKKDRTLVPDLIALLEDDDDGVMRSAYQALTSITAKDFGPAPKATKADRSAAAADWMAWWKKQNGK
jgi:hypothetical protein